MSVSRNKHFQSFTVGKLDAGMAILIGERAHLIEFPSLLLPAGTVSGSIVSISVLRDHAAERNHAAAFTSLQDGILEAYGTHSPKAPVLSLLNTTQTSVTLEWGRLNLASASLRSVEIYRNGSRLAGIPNPAVNTSTKLSSLQLDTDYTFQLVMKTTAGTFPSNVIRVRTHTMNDTSGISVCFGNVQDPKLLHQAQVALDQMGARYSDKIQIDTTHFVCTTPAGPTGSGPSVEYQKALQLTLPVVEPGWIFACMQEKKMVPISQHLLGSNSTYNPINNASFARLQSDSNPSSPQSATFAQDGAGIERQPSPETRARSSIPDTISPGSVAPEEDARPVFERPPSVTGGKLNRGFKFPLSTDTLPLQKEDDDAAGAQPPAAPAPVIAAPAIIHEDDSDAEATAAPSAAQYVEDKTPTAPSAEFKVVDVDAPEMVTVAPGDVPAAETEAPFEVAEQRPRPSVPELVFSPPPEEQAAPSFAAFSAADPQESTPVVDAHQVEPTRTEAAAEEQPAEDPVQNEYEQGDTVTTVDGSVTPAAELEAETPSEEKTEVEASSEEALEEVKLAEDLVEPTLMSPETGTPDQDDEISIGGLVSADATDDDAGGGEGAAEAAETSGGGDGAATSKPKSKKKKKKTKSIAK